MLNNIKFTILLLFIPLILIGQESDDKMPILKQNKELYTTFNKFYTDSIRQETKDEWGGPYFYKIDLVYGIHYLDYNKDGVNDVLVEFSSYASDGGTWYFFTAVLFENLNGKYRYIAHIDPDYNVFEKYENSIFYFTGVRFKTLLDENRKKSFKLVYKKFIEQ